MDICNDAHNFNDYKKSLFIIKKHSDKNNKISRTTVNQLFFILQKKENGWNQTSPFIDRPSFFRTLISWDISGIFIVKNR